MLKGNDEASPWCVVATIGFLMGMDLPNIKNVYAYDPLPSMTWYAQCIGRPRGDGVAVSHCGAHETARLVS